MADYNTCESVPTGAPLACIVQGVSVPPGCGGGAGWHASSADGEDGSKIEIKDKHENK